jgi:hypothetical protein
MAVAVRRSPRAGLQFSGYVPPFAWIIYLISQSNASISPEFGAPTGLLEKRDNEVSEAGRPMILFFSLGLLPVFAELA